MNCGIVPRWLQSENVGIEDSRPHTYCAH